ncbi:hypothetical protein D3C86_1351170 [compost metagenome]
MRKINPEFRFQSRYHLLPIRSDLFLQNHRRDSHNPDIHHRAFLIEEPIFFDPVFHNVLGIDPGGIPVCINKLFCPVHPYRRITSVPGRKDDIGFLAQFTEVIEYFFAEFGIIAIISSGFRCNRVFKLISV